MARGFPVLYDTTHEDYMRAKLKDDLWEKIAKELNTDGIEKKTKHCGLAYGIIFDDANPYPNCKRIIGFFYGIFLGIIFYEVFLTKLNFPPGTLIILGSLVTILSAVGNAVSRQIRCITLLTLPTFFGKTGRGLLKAMIFSYLITGPYENTISNFKEAGRSMSCTSMMLFNLTKLSYEVFVKPYKDAITGVKIDTSHLKDALNQVQDVVGPIAQEIEGDDDQKYLEEKNDYMDEKQGDTKRTYEIQKKYEESSEENENQGNNYEKKYFKKLETRCQNLVSGAERKCYSIFKDLQEKCEDIIPWMFSWLICSPMKLTFLCNIVNVLGGDDACDPTNDLSSGFGEGYLSAKQTKDNLKNQFSKPKLKYKMLNLPNVVDVKSTYIISAEILHNLSSKKNIVDYFLVFVHRVVAFAFIIVILRAQKYLEKYLQDIDYDNYYLTAEFRRLDAIRYYKNKMTLLPLKGAEKNEFIDPYSFALKKTEQESVFTDLYASIITLILCFVFFFLDHLTFVGLNEANYIFRFNVVAEASSDVNLEIKGTGFIAIMFRSFFKGFKFKKHVKINLSNEDCLPRPHKLEYKYYFKVFGTTGAVYGLSLFNAYFNRLRRAICAFFFPTREKERILALYHKTFLQRVQHTRMVAKNIANYARDGKLYGEDTLNFLYHLRKKYPRIFWWLEWFAAGRCHCLICDDPEVLGVPHIKCPTCGSFYCHQCWIETNSTCQVCLARSPQEGSTITTEARGETRRENVHVKFMYENKLKHSE